MKKRIYCISLLFLSLFNLCVISILDLPHFFASMATQNKIKKTLKFADQFPQTVTSDEGTDQRTDAYEMAVLAEFRGTYRRNNSSHDEITQLADFDDMFHRTFDKVDRSIRSKVVEFERVKTLLISFKQTRTGLFVDQHQLVAKIKQIRETAKIVSDASARLAPRPENDMGEFDGYDSDCEFEYGTRPSVKAMVKLRKILANIRDVDVKITDLYSQLDTIRETVHDPISSYVNVIRSAHSVTRGMSIDSQCVARDIFCWAKIECGICTHHQRNKCIYGENCRKAHIPILNGYPLVTHQMYTDPSLYV